jgi:signal transduction histidine kinase
MRDKGFIVYENGLPVKMIGSLQDVSHLKQLENNLNEEKFARQKKISETVIHVQEKERTRIGHELNDNVNQLLSTSKLFIDMMSPLDKEQKKFKEKSIDYILMAIEEIRKLSKELVVPQLKNTSLAESINAIIQDIHQTTNIKISFSFNEDEALLSSGKKLTIFRIVQEQIKNIIKHSKATEVEISIKNEEGATCLLIKDNGIGFNSDQSYSGIGLSNIFERTRFYNGSVIIDTAPGKGCLLKISIPLH